ncbi:hypothetical protein KUTeg_016920, partial [Tegillarca granosa]
KPCSYSIPECNNQRVFVPSWPVFATPVPVEKVDVWLRALEDITSDYRSVVAFIDYVSKTWFKNNFPIWNHYETK